MLLSINYVIVIYVHCVPSASRAVSAAYKLEGQS